MWIPWPSFTFLHFTFTLVIRINERSSELVLGPLCVLMQTHARLLFLSLAHSMTRFFLRCHKTKASSQLSQDLKHRRWLPILCVMKAQDHLFWVVCFCRQPVGRCSWRASRINTVRMQLRWFITALAFIVVRSPDIDGFKLFSITL